MAQYDFSSMDSRQIAETIFFNRNAANVPALFNALDQAGSPRYEEVLQTLNVSAAADLEQGASVVGAMLKVARFFHQEPDLTGGNPDQLAAAQALAEMCRSVADRLGSATHPLVAAYVEEVNHLTPTEYNSAKLVLAAVDALETYKNGGQRQEPHGFGKLPETKKELPPAPPPAAPQVPPVTQQGKKPGGRHFKL